MTTHPNCKINLGLHVTERRPDGYHNLETIFIPIPLCDSLTINTSDRYALYQVCIKSVSTPEENICTKAYRLLCEEYPQIGGAEVHLEKNIPIGAGLGGGSSDGAHTIIMLNNIFNLGLTDEQMCSYAARLGADCPFFIYNRPCYATGIGDHLEPLNFRFPISNLHFVLLKPPVAVSTADAYRGIVPKRSDIDLRKAVKQPVEKWRDLIVNDFETTVFPKYPIIAEMKQYLYDRGAVYASMSGSGSALFAFFKEQPDEKLPYEIYRSNDF